MKRPAWSSCCGNGTSWNWPDAGTHMPYKGIIFDIDGVLEYQGKVFPGAVDTVQELRRRDIPIRFLTNSTLKSRASCMERLQRSGFPSHVHEVITASFATACYLRELKPRSIWLMQYREGRDEFWDFVHDRENPEYIVIGDGRDEFDFDHLNQALRLIARGAKLVGMIPELVDSSLGELELNVGSWVSLLERASGKEAVYIGKPHPYCYQLALAGMELEPSRVLAVGDRVGSDILGARRARPGFSPGDHR